MHCTMYAYRTSYMALKLVSSHASERIPMILCVRVRCNTRKCWFISTNSKLQQNLVSFPFLSLPYCIISFIKNLGWGGFSPLSPHLSTPLCLSHRCGGSIYSKVCPLSKAMAHYAHINLSILALLFDLSIIEHYNGNNHAVHGVLAYSSVQMHKTTVIHHY